MIHICEHPSYFREEKMISHTTTSELIYSTMKLQTSSIVLGLSSSKGGTGVYEAGSWCSGTRRSPYCMTSYMSL